MEKILLLGVSQALASTWSYWRLRLFSDTPKGAHASAVHYSLVEMAKANGLKPDEYYRYILERLPYAETVEDMEALLPWNVKAALEKNSD